MQNDDRDPKPLPPEKPLATDCCESGCDRCVFDIYADELEHYEAMLSAWERRQAERSTDADAAQGEHPTRSSPTQGEQH